MNGLAREQSAVRLVDVGPAVEEADDLDVVSAPDGRGQRRGANDRVRRQIVNEESDAADAHRSHRTTI